MFKSIEVVRKGDNIKDTYLDDNRRLKVEKGPGTDVGKIEHRACSSLGTHINSRACYAPGAMVWVTASKPKEEIEIRDYAMYDTALSITGLGEILTVDGQAYLNAENARTDPAEQLLVEIFSDPDRLDGALHTIIDKVAKDGLVSANDARKAAGLRPL